MDAMDENAGLTGVASGLPTALFAGEVEDDPLWYKDAVIYEVHVKAFYDSTGDGMGDLRGLTSKLDYLKDLGVTAIWLLPFYPSPLKDDGYDISDFSGVLPQYGTLNDFREFLKEAHDRGMRVITELILNHTSDQHSWFKKSRVEPPGSEWRELYTWSDSPEKYKDARIIFNDFEPSNWTWDPVGKAYFWHRFYSHQPDLNYDNPLTQRLMLDVVAHWLKFGVDGLRLDAVPYLFEREGTTCENLPQTHEFLKKLRKYVDSNFKDRMLLAEANQWPSDAVAYFGQGDECHMAFHFPLMPRMFMGIQTEDRFPIVDILEQTPQIPESCQWALFLRNHDELTLEMVTDEERDYMYRVFARDKQARINLGIRRRLAPLLGNDRRQIELMNFILFMLPGTPVIYYGDEIGMGDNIYLGDRNGVRTPMQWSAAPNAGFSGAKAQKLYLPVIIEPQYHYEVVNVENQESDPASLLWWMKKLISTRKRFKALRRGGAQFLHPDNPKTLVFTRNLEGEVLLVAVNLSRNPQSVELNLANYEGYFMNEVFGGIPFHPVTGAGYRLTFGPYGYYLFSLTKPETTIRESSFVKVPELTIRKFQDLFRGGQKEKLEEQILPAYLRAARWFGSKGRRIERINIRDSIELVTGGNPCYLLILDVSYNEGLPEAYLLPMAFSSAQEFDQSQSPGQQVVIAKAILEKGEQVLILDAVHDPRFRASLLHVILNGEVAKGDHAEIRGSPSGDSLLDPKEMTELGSRLVGAEQSNTSVIFGDRVIMKLLRRVEEGVSPEVEIGDFLTKQSFPHTPRLLGSLQYWEAGSEPATIAVLQDYVKNDGDAWKLFTSEFRGFLLRAGSTKDDTLIAAVPRETKILALSDQGIRKELQEMIGRDFLEKVGLLGRRTAEFHLALMKGTDRPDFRPEPFGYLYQMALAQSMISYTRRTLRLASKAELHGESLRRELAGVIAHQEDVTGRFMAIRQKTMACVRIRVHGDYHLGQVLYSGNDFVIIDYEGEPARSFDDRRIKRSSIRDVAGMIRSFQYVVYSALLDEKTGEQYRGVSQAERWGTIWYKSVAATFLGAYLDATSDFGLVPSDRDALSVLLDAFLLEKATYELAYELNNRPKWVVIPLRGIEELLGIEVDNADEGKKQGVKNG
jgi:maltose alpha-D-glucosyltransferase / alpha-amylase